MNRRFSGVHEPTKSHIPWNPPGEEQKGGTREIRSPRVDVLVGVVLAADHGVDQAMLLTLTHTHAHRATDDGGGVVMGSRGGAMMSPVSVHDGIGGGGRRGSGVVL